MKQMIAAYLNGAGRIELVREPIPAVQPGKILVRVRAVGICGSDVHYYRHGRIGPFVPAGPLILGHESAGEVVEAGEGVSAFSPGERVTLEPGVPCGRCDACKRGRYNLCPHVYFMGSAPDQHGAFRQYLLWDPAFAYKLPDTLSFAEGALIEPLAAAVYAADRAGVRPGDRVTVFGCGPVGLLILQTALARGAAVVYAADPGESRRRKAVELGAARVIDPTEVDLAETVNRELGGADAVFEAAGSPDSHRQSLEAAAAGGRVVLVGWTTEAIQSLDVHQIGVKELEIKGMFRYRNVYPEALALAVRAAVRLEQLISHRYPLAQVEKALDLAASREPGTLKIVMENDG